MYDVADASGWLIAPASCTKMCNIDSVRLERHDSVLAGSYQGTESQKVQAAVQQGCRHSGPACALFLCVRIDQIALMDR